MKKYKILIISFIMMSVMSCQDFLTQHPDTIFDDETIFSDEEMLKSVIAGFYGRIGWGQSFSNDRDYGILDEACIGDDVDNSTTYDVNLWRIYDYGLIRNLNQFIQSIRKTSVLSETDKLKYEAEVRFIRAWTYFNMAKGLGGLAIVGDAVYEYDPDIDVAEYQVARSSEAATYDYIMSECDFAAKYLPDDPAANTNAARAISWVALALKARAAIYAASLAKYNNLVTPDIKTEGGEVGIPAEMAEKYYKIAFQTCDTIIQSGKYALYNKENDKAHNFYMVTASKEDNPEVIWAQDYKSPTSINAWSAYNCPAILSASSTSNRCTPLLNLVEAFEYTDNRDGHLKITDKKGDPVFYDSPEDIFAGKDPRLHGTVICNGDVFSGTEILYQAGQWYYSNRKWRERKGAIGTTDDAGDVLTSINGPQVGTGWYANKTGFNFRKFLDEDLAAMDNVKGSEIWFVRFRYAEILMIASEACLELGQEKEALYYINQIRERAGIPDLKSMTILDIEQERRVEFALENHRWWDLKRWRRAHIVWDGKSEDSQHYTLFPYRVKDRRRPENGKWAYVRGTSPLRPNPRTFNLNNYYNTFDNSWLTNNPKLVKNPYQ